MATMNMTPMIDVVFNLIIFFMTVSQISESNREPMELPSQKGSEDQKPAVLVININDRGEMIVSGNTHPLSEVISMVGNELARLGDDSNRLTIVLRADRRVACESVNRTVDALARLRITKLRFAVQVPE